MATSFDSFIGNSAAGQGLSPSEVRGAVTGARGEVRYRNRDFRAEQQAQRRQQMIQSLAVLAALGGRGYYNRRQQNDLRAAQGPGDRPGAFGPGPAPAGPTQSFAEAQATQGPSLESRLADLLVLQGQRNRPLRGTGLPQRPPLYARPLEEPY